MNDKQFFVETVQAAVGQGGLHWGNIIHKHGNFSRQFTYVFDCGSLNRHRLAEEIEGIDSENIDVLFISHLDADHINGIELLLESRKVHTVVIPCLDAVQLTIAACKSLAASSINGEFRRFIGSPYAWFAQRGVRRLYEVSRDSEDGDLPSPFGPEDFPDSDSFEGSLRGDSGMSLEVVSRGPQAPAAKGEAKIAPMERIVLGAFSTLAVSMPNANNQMSRIWTLIPYVHPFDSVVLRHFKHSVSKTLNCSSAVTPAGAGFSKRLLNALRDPEKRAALKRCYALLASDHNEVSMSLYAGPPAQRNIGWYQKYDPYNSRYEKHWAWLSVGDTYPFHGSAWLCTGDANLKKRRTRDRWLARYKPFFSQVCQFVLPHHGSIYNLASEVVDLMGNAHFLVCAASDSAHHPHPKVVSSLRARNTWLWQVSEKGGSCFRTIAECHLHP